MASQQIVDYIREQLTAGHSEARLRQHLLTSGWSQPDVEDAFEAYHQTVNPRATRSSLKERAKKLRRGGKLAKRTKGRRIKWAVAGAVAVAVVVTGYAFYGRHTELTPVSTVSKPLTYKQKQINDVNTVAGAIAQFSVDNGGLPSQLLATSDGSLTLCGSTCDVASATIAPLRVYLPNGVKIQRYSSGFMTTDKEMMYLIPGAKCADVHNLGAVNTNPRAMVIMYAQENGPGVTPRCVTL